MNKFVVTFPSQSSTHFGNLGGKGSNLYRVSKAGFPVPPGLVVTSEAYRLWQGNSSVCSDYTSNFAYDKPDQLELQSKQLREELEKQPIPGVILSEIKEAIKSFDEADAFAVRSSSTFEDLKEAAFAGQHDTYLNCRGHEDILLHLKRCWCSLWTSRAILYRQTKGFSHLEASMAVVIQKQIACEKAGVAFSIHPVNGKSSIVAIDANYGLGESVVSGEFPVDHFEIEKRTHRVAGSLVSKKTHRIVAEKSGTKLEEVPADLADSACLSEVELVSVAGLVEKVERYFGWPQDIEWGLADNKLYLLQSRPITKIPERWTRDESAERFPRPSTPLSWDYMHRAFTNSLAVSIPMLGLPPFEGDWFQRKGWFIYGNQNAVDVLSLFSPISAQSIEELAAEQSRLSEAYQWVTEFSSLWMRDLDRYLVNIGRCSARHLDQMNDGELLDHLEELAQIACDYFQPNIAISMGQALLHKALFHVAALLTGREGAIKLLDGLLSGIETKTVQVNAELYQLSRELLQEKALLKDLDPSGGAEALKNRKLDTCSSFKLQFERFVQDHGHRELYQDYYYPTWGENPAVVLDLVTILARDEHAQDPRIAARAGRVKFVEAEARLLQSTPKELEFFVRELIRLARSFTALDDLEHYQTTRVNPLARKGALAIGTRLVNRGLLTRNDQVFFLNRSELRDAVLGDGRNILTLAHQRAKEFEQQLKTAPEWVFGQSDVEAQEKDPSSLKGIPGSPGEVEGPCYLVDDTADFSKFPKGSILVARTTNPAWTPLFYIASGVVTESGGPLSHGAVTAREMGLPAVMAVRNVMNKLKSGDKIKVNGSAGVVQIISAT